MPLSLGLERDVQNQVLQTGVRQFQHILLPLENAGEL